jgi:hypothetical protein
MDDLTGDEIPSWRADPEIFREEDFSFAFKAKGPGFSGELNLNRRGSERSPTAMATTMLILVAEACIAAISIAVICKLAGAPALVLLVAALAGFAGVMIAGTFFSFRRSSPRSGPGILPAHLSPLRPARPNQGGAAQALSREAHHNGHGAGKEQTGDKDEQPGSPNGDPQRRRRRNAPGR